MKEVKEWVIHGFIDEIKEIIDLKLMDDKNSYWFRYRTLSWFRIRRIKGKFPENTITKVLMELGIEAKVWRKNLGAGLYTNWVIESKVIL
ncbi:MAG: hypothetical protein ACW964_04470 [Candidatus Hodarchaeales archaeon]|jgi:hypothetical protein